MSEKRPNFMTETEAILKESVRLVRECYETQASYAREGMPLVVETVRTMTQLAIAEKERK